MVFDPQWVGPAIRAGAAAYAAYSSTRTNRTRGSNAVVQPTGGASVSRRRRRIGRSKRWSNSKLKKAIIGSGDEYIFRWQQTSNTYLGPGQLFLGWSEFGPTVPGQLVPMHFMSLTNCGTLGNVVNAKGCFAHGMSRALYYPTGVFGGQFQWAATDCQDRTGLNTVALGPWQMEKGVDVQTIPTVRGNLFHKYTDIKLNLYGTLNVPITYTVMLCTMKEQVDPFQYNALSYFGNGTETNNFFRDLMRPRLWDTVGSNANPKWPGDVKIIKQARITINPPAKSDAADQDLAPTALSIHELRWFVRHDRRRDYKWSKQAQQLLQDNDFTSSGWDVQLPNENLIDVEWGKRVYLVVMATDPFPEPFASFAGLSDQYANFQTMKNHGSYDICVRNCFVQSY